MPTSLISYTPDSPPSTSDPFEAEQALRKIEAETGLAVMDVKPTFVYEPGVKANFLNMMKVLNIQGT